MDDIVTLKHQHTSLPGCCHIPQSDTILRRERLQQALAACRGIAWLHAPAGMGKTSAAAAFAHDDVRPVIWLELSPGTSDPALLFESLSLAVGPLIKPRSLPGFSADYRYQAEAFAERFFRALGGQLAYPVLLVLDNAESLGDADFCAALASSALHFLPAGSLLIVTSRLPPPPQLALEQARERCRCIGPDELAFSSEEAETLLENRRPWLSGEQRQQLIELANGWPALLTLLCNSPMEQQQERAHDSATLFDYLEREVIEQLATPIRHALLASAFCPEPDEHALVTLSGDPNAAEHLEQLVHQGLLITHRGKQFRIHPLLRDFLQTRAWQGYGEEERRETIQRTIDFLLEQQRHEDTVPLLVALQQWDQLARLCLEQAMPLIAKSRIDTLAQWLQQLPQALRQQNPWLLFWQAVCQLDADPLLARQGFEQAHALFVTAEDPVGQLIACSGALDTFWREWGSFREVDPWLARVPAPDHPLYTRLPPTLTGRIAIGMFMTLVMRRPNDPHLHDWEALSLKILHQPETPPAELMLCITALIYYASMGSPARARLLFDHLSWLGSAEQAPPLLRLAWHLAEGVYYATYDSNPDTAIAALERGIALGHQTGIPQLEVPLHTFAALAMLSKHDARAAAIKLDLAASQLPRARLLDRHLYALTRAWLAVQQGEGELALEFARQSLALAEESATPHTIFKASVMAAQAAICAHQWPLARRHLARARQIRRLHQSLELDFILGLVLALSALHGGHHQAAKRRLSDALACGREAGLRQFIVGFDADQLARLLAMACLWRIELPYVEQLIRGKQLSPPEEMRPAAWPWRLRIVTLGEFAFYRVGERLVDSLWPNSDGETGRSAFDTNLSRLRRWLGIKDALLLHEGRLSINPQLCWVDAEAFEIITKKRRPSDIELEEARQLYAGDFMPEEEEY